MPFDQWMTFYSAVQAQRLQDQAALLAAVNAAQGKNPKRVHQKLIQGAKELLAGPKPSVASDPRRLREMLQRIPGIRIEQKGDG